MQGVEGELEMVEDARYHHQKAASLDNRAIDRRAFQPGVAIYAVCMG